MWRHRSAGLVVAMICGACGAVPMPTGASPSPTAQPLIATCETPQLEITTTNPGAGLGVTGAWVRFVNRASGPCQLQGWPTLVGVTAQGASTTARPSNVVMTFPTVAGVPTVILVPGGAAVAAFEGSSNSEGPCPPPYHSLEVTPPGGASSVTLSGFNAWAGQDTPACAGLAVTMVIPAAAMPNLDSPAEP
jgi:Protein of unknown function (DUF4232)